MNLFVKSRYPEANTRDPLAPLLWFEDPHSKFSKRLGFYLDIANTVAKRSTCPRKSVGAVIVDPLYLRIVSMGFNGSVPNTPHCTDAGCLIHEGRCIRTIHAELNALANLQRIYDRDLALVCTVEPCLNCLKILLAARIPYIFFLEEYYYQDREKFLAHSLDSKEHYFARIG